MDGENHKVNRLTILYFPLFIAVLLSLTTGHFHPSSAGETLSLPTLLEEARNKNPELQAARERVRAKEMRARAESALDDPTLRVELEDLSREHPLNAAPGNTMLTRYTVSQMFPFPGKRSLKEKIALKDALAAETDFKARELDVTFMVKEAYYDLAFLAESVKVIRETKELLTYMAGIAEARYSTGAATQQDVIKVQLESAMLNNELITLEAQRDASAARLKSFIGMPQDSSLPGTPAPVSKERVEINTDELIKRANMANPRIKGMEYEIQANDLSVDLAGKNYYPDFMIGVAPIQREGRFDSWDLMFQINIPVWRGKYGSLRGEAVANRDSLRLMLASEKNRLGFEVKDAALKAEAAGRIMTLYETTLVPQSELSFESALKNYQTGKVDFLTLLDTQRALKKTKLENLSAVIDYRKKIAALEKAVGFDLYAGR